MSNTRSTAVEGDDDDFTSPTSEQKAAHQRDMRDYMLRKEYPLGKIIETIVDQHQYGYKDKGDKPDDQGWWTCSCKTWQGYWSGFNEHVGEAIAEELRRMKLSPADTLIQDLRKIESALFCSIQTAVREDVQENLFWEGLHGVRDLITGMSAEIIPGGVVDDPRTEVEG